MGIYLALLYFLIIQVAFDRWAPSQSLEWSILYWISFWMGLVIVATNRFLYDEDVVRRKMYLPLTIPMWYKILAVHLYAYLSGMTYEEWYYYAANKYNELLFMCLLLGILLFIIIRSLVLWKKSKTNGG